jgi:rare lipoprotein A
VRSLAFIALVLVVQGCVTTRTAPQPKPDQTLHGVASWYGEEFAGRTTANGEIFDPLQLTAAHRTLPFGTVVDVKNAKTRQTVRVRINDRGPFVGNRMIDLSYAAAQQIGLIDPGSGDVDVVIVSVGRGDREPPAPYSVTIAEPKEKASVSSAEPPNVVFPLPGQVTTKPGSDANFGVEVVEEQGGVETRKQVSPDGRSIVTVPVDGSKAGAEKPRDTPAAPGHGAAAVYDRTQRETSSSAPSQNGRFVVQVGAFSVEANATALQQRLTSIGQKSYVDHDVLYRVRIGPFSTRDDAIKARSALEANGISAIVLAE